MNLEEYRTVFIVATLGLTLIVAAPTLGLVVPARPSEHFSEFRLLDSNHMGNEYPFDVRVGEVQSVFVAVSHMGSPTYYVVHAKLRNQTQPLPDFSSSTPSPLPALYAFHFFVAGGTTWESPLTFQISDASVVDDRMVVNNISINGVTVATDTVAGWDAERQGFYYQLFLELWLYNQAAQSFQYYDRFVGIWFRILPS